MVERGNYRYPRYRSRQPPIADLREVLNRKKEEREHAEQKGKVNKGVSSPPPDPPSLLRDSLRGDDPTTLQQKSGYRSYGSRGRGSFRRNYGGPRGLNHNNRDSSSSSPHKHKPPPCNIKVEFSTETGHRKCTVENTQLPKNFDRTRSENYERGNFRGRSRQRGNYQGRYVYHRQNRRFHEKHTNVSDNTETEQVKNNSDNFIKDVKISEEENWDNDGIDYPKDQENVVEDAEDCGEQIYDEHYSDEFLFKNINDQDHRDPNEDDYEKQEGSQIETELVEKFENTVVISDTRIKADDIGAIRISPDPEKSSQIVDKKSEKNTKGVSTTKSEPPEKSSGQENTVRVLQGSDEASKVVNKQPRETEDVFKSKSVQSDSPVEMGAKENKAEIIDEEAHENTEDVCESKSETSAKLTVQ